MIVRDIRTLQFDKEQPVFFDANAWLSIYPATSNETNRNWACDYTDLYKRLTKYNAPIMINAMVMSEYINRFCRIEHEAYCKSYKFVEYKEYRNSGDFKYTAAAAAGSAKEILETACQVGIDGELDLESCVSDVKTGSVDFNDSVYIATCLRNGWPIVTNDSDFVSPKLELEIWTANDSMLKKARAKGIYQKG